MKEIKHNPHLYCIYCEETFDKQRYLMFHLKKIHNVSDYSQYIVNNYFDGIWPTCKCGCGTKMTFESHHDRFFNEYTKNHFPRKPHTEDTKRRIKATYIKVMLERYGVTNPMHLQECIDKIGDTKEKNHGNRNYNNPEKNKQTKSKTHGDPNYNNRPQALQTNLDRYGAVTFTATEEGKRSVAATKLCNYGDPYYNNMEKNMQTKLDKYGYTSEFLNPEWRRKYNRNYSKIEKHIAKSLNANHRFRYFGYEFDMLYQEKYLIEVDGDYYHPFQLIELNFIQLTNAVNDFKKINIVVEKNEFSLIRVLVSKIRRIKNITFKDILDNSHIPDYTINVDQILMSTNYIINEHHNRGCEYVYKKSKNFIKFLRTFVPTAVELPGQWYDDKLLLKSVQHLLGVSDPNDIADITIKNIIEILEK